MKTNNEKAKEQQKSINGITIYNLETHIYTDSEADKNAQEIRDIIVAQEQRPMVGIYTYIETTQIITNEQVGGAELVIEEERGLAGDSQ